MRRTAGVRGRARSNSVPWTVVSTSGERQSVPNSGQLIRLIVEGNVTRDALLCEPGAGPRALGDVPGLNELFADQRLRLFLKAQMKTWSVTATRGQWRRRGSVMASVALMTAFLAGAYFAHQRSSIGRGARLTPPAAQDVR
jgi:hypothetical protein